MMNAESNDQPPTNSNDEQPKKRRKAGRKLPLQETIKLPEPANGRHYSKVEFLSIMSMVKGRQERSTLINKMAHSQVPVGRSQMYEALSQETRGLPNNPLWNAKGAPRLISKEGLVEIYSDLHRMGGNTIGNKEVCENIIEFQQEAIRRLQGRVPMGVHI
jgi:hypothetical protein